LIPLCILVVDDSQAWRQYVCSMLQQHLDQVVICESSDGLVAVKKSKELLDIGIPDLNGLEVARQIRSFAPRSRILFVTSYDWPELSREAMNIGALGLVVKSAAARDLLPAISAVLRDEQFFGSGFLSLDPTERPHP
jgi:DNA-binding NarL/FixJ family response regulator